MIEPPPEPDREERLRDRIAFYPVAVVGVIFCMSIFVVIVADFGDPQAVNPVNLWVKQHANTILIFEAALLITMGMLAMVIDRIRTLRKQAAVGQPSRDEDADRVD